MIPVTIDNTIREYPEGTTWSQVARDYQHLYDDDILLVQVNGKLQELHKYVKPCELRFVTAREKPGMSAYQRSATLLMLKAFYSVAGADNLEKIIVDFSVGKGLFVEPRESDGCDAGASCQGKGEDAGVRKAGDPHHEAERVDGGRHRALSHT